ncbi:MAG: GtrA family protein [Prevotellaceae bacterium]|nr:GtrA family protein [Prevotellaceae bacterium]
MRFAIVGLIATGIHYGVYLILLHLLNPTISYTIGYILSFCINFVLTNVFTFKTQANIKRGIGFVASHAINYGLHIALLNLFLYLSLPEQYAPIPVYAIAIPVNFLLIRFVFRSKWTQ